LSTLLLLLFSTLLLSLRTAAKAKVAFVAAVAQNVVDFLSQAMAAVFVFVIAVNSTVVKVN